VIPQDGWVTPEMRARRLRRQPVRNDVTYLAIIIAFFALAALFVVACDRLIGSDEEALGELDDAPAPTPEAEELAA